MSETTHKNLNRRQFAKTGAVAAAGMAAAATGKTATASSGSSPRHFAARSAQATTITFSATGDANVEQPVFKDIIEMFNSAQSDVVVEYQPFPEGGYEKAIAMLQSGETPDIMRIDDDMVYLVSSSGKAHDLTGYFSEYPVDDFHAYLFHELAVQDKQFALPMCDSVWSWMYNKSIFSEAGVTVPTSWTDAWEWDFAVENFHKLAKKNGDFTEVFAGQVGHGEEMPFEAGVGHYNHNMTKTNFNHPRVVEALTRAAKLQYEEQVCLPPGAGEALDLFNASQLGFINNVQSNAVSISPDIDWDFAPPPKASTYAMGSPFTRAFILPVDGPAKNPDAAWAFFEWYLHSEEAQKRVLEGAWGVPPLKSLTTVENLGATSWGTGRNVNILIEGLDYAYPRVSTPFTDAMATNWKGGKNREEVMLGSRSPEEFCADVDSLIQQTMDEAAASGWTYVAPPHNDLDSQWTRWYYEGEAQDDDPRVVGGLPKDDPAV